MSGSGAPPRLSKRSAVDRSGSCDVAAASLGRHPPAGFARTAEMSHVASPEITRGESTDAWYDEWRDRVEIRHPPKSEPWGARTFDVIDPFGNTIFVMGPVE